MAATTVAPSSSPLKAIVRVFSSIWGAIRALARNRIGLSMKTADGGAKPGGDNRPARNDARPGGKANSASQKGRAPEPQKETVHSPFAQLAKVKLG